MPKKSSINSVRVAWTVPYPTAECSQIYEEFGISANTLKNWREHPESGFIGGIHYMKLNKRVILYNRVLVHSFIHHGPGTPEHQQEIDRYVQFLNS